MITTDVTHEPSFSAGLWTSRAALSPWIGDAISIRGPESEFLPGVHESILSIEVPTFNTKVFGKVVEVVAQNGQRELTFESSLDPKVRGSLKITTRYSSEDTSLRSEASLRFFSSEHTPQALFIVDTLYALLGLGGQIRLFDPDANQHILLSFSISLPELSELLQRRQMYFALMIIEKAVGTNFDVPEYVSGDEMSDIFFASRAIVERHFVWRVNKITLPVPANAEMLAWLRSLKPSQPNASTYRMEFGPTPVRKVIFGKQVPLGDEKVFIEDGIIENYDLVGASLAQLDGRSVLIQIRPVSRVGRYLFANSPSLRGQRWDGAIQDLIDLDSSLSQHLTARYLALMSIIIPELPPEQVYALISPETIGKISERARERRVPVDKYVNELLDQQRLELNDVANINLARIKAAIELLSQDKKTELFRFITTHLRDKAERPDQPYEFIRSKRGFPISKGRARFTSADVARMDSES